MLKKAKTILLVGAALYAVWCIVMLIMNAVSYASYIEYYGLMQVLPSIVDGFFGYASWAFVLFGLAAIIDILAKKEEPVVFEDQEYAEPKAEALEAEEIAE